MKKSYFLLVAVFIVVLSRGPVCLAAKQSSNQGKLEETDKILSIFNVLGKSVTRGKKPAGKGKTKSKEVIFPEHLVPTELRGEVSPKTIEAETFRIRDSELPRNRLLRQKTDDRQSHRPNYKLIAALLLTLAYILCSFLVHRHHHKNLPKHT